MGTASDRRKPSLGLSGSPRAIRATVERNRRPRRCRREGGVVSEDSPVRRVAHGEPAEQRSEEYGTEVVALADRDPPRFPDRWVNRGLDHGWRRFAGFGAGGGPDRGRNCWGGGMVRPTAFCLVAVGPGDMRGNGGWPDCGRGPGRLWVGRGDLALMGAVTGLGVGVFQALVLVQAGHSISNAVLWAVANPPAWALAWLVSSYVIARNIGERYPVFGASGCVVFGLLTWLLLAALIRRASETQGTTNATAR